ncbi:hypothetical protein CTKZ_08640 [Cellulomonas algicola]|uniref:Type VII secretion system protein EssD-like domain-containing protein n=1 Tax=Cellulomonas algicola TaxID=2071633 RepID=A0A401UXE2_9CELL|nr:DNA/RNA non-specific endonuclease [Cellulomonas algicola]GCD19302.1 hypothetical protein CTKZ_08640 [Cellulomonas algicola]
MSTLHRAIDPTTIPGDALDPDGVLAAADALAAQGAALREHGAQAVARWRGLSAVYEAPEAGRLFTVMDPVETGARDVGDGVELLAAALRRYAEAIRPIKASLARTRTDARAFRSSIASNSEWRQDQGLVDANTDLVERVNAQQVALWEAERACANEIRALYCAAPWHASTGEDDPLGYGYAALPAEAAMPWGSAVKREDACPKAAAVQVKRFVWDGVVVDGLWGTVTGLAGFVGFRDWRYSNATLRETWMGMSDLFPFTVMGVVMHLSDGSGVYSAQRTGTAWIGLGKGMVSWDTWDDDPGRAAGGAVFNIATVLLPAGAAVSGTKGAATAANAAGKGAKVSAWLARGAEIVDLTDPLALGARGLRGALPRLDDLVAGLRGVEGLDETLTLDLPPATSTLDDLPSGTVHDGLGGVAVRDVDAMPQSRATVDGTHAPERAHVPERELVTADGRADQASGGTGGDGSPGGGHRADAPHSGGLLDGGTPHVGGAGSPGGPPPDATAPRADVPPTGAAPGALHGRTVPDLYPRPASELEVTVRPDDSGFPGSRTPFAARTDLAPSTLYRVEGRGDFYTDADGRVRYVETTYGGLNNLNADLNNPQDGVTYVVHPHHGGAHVFEIGLDGRTEVAYTDDLALGAADRSESVQTRVGAEGGPGYDGGHLYANMYGGGGEYVNIVAMLERVNRSGPGSFYELEQQWRSLIDGHPPVHVSVRITPDYVGSSRVPDSILVEWSENGAWKDKVFENVVD